MEPLGSGRRQADLPGPLAYRLPGVPPPWRTASLAYSRPPERPFAVTTVSSLLNRAALVVAAPLSGCVLLAALLAGEWRGELQEAENVVVRTQLEVDIGRLVHALQAERGVAAAAAARVDGL